MHIHKYINYDVYGENVLSYQVISKKQFIGDVYIKGKNPPVCYFRKHTGNKFALSSTENIASVKEQDFNSAQLNASLHSARKDNHTILGELGVRTGRW